MPGIKGYDNLTKPQRRMLRTIARMCDAPHGDGYAHDAEGDLSLCSGRPTLVLNRLREMGLVGPWTSYEPDYYYTEIRLTDRGREVAQCL